MEQNPKSLTVGPSSYAGSPRRDILQLEALHILKAFAADLVDIDDPEAVLWAVAERTISQLGWVDCVIYLRDPERDVLIQKAAFGPKSIDYRAIFQPIEIPIGRGVVGKVASTGAAMCIADTSTFHDYITDDATRLSELAVPIRWGDEVLGVIDSEHPDADFFQVEDQLILETISGITATKIQNARNAKVNADLALFYKENPNPVLQLSENRQVTFINQSALRCFPRRERSLLGMEGLAEALFRARSGDISLWTCAIPGTDKANPDTDARHFEFHVVALDNGSYNLYGKDVSHIIKLQRAAEVAHAAKSRFLSVMSHEIRTPLNAILGLTDLLQHEEINRQEQLQHLAYMDFSGQHLLSLVNDILDLEKLASGKAQSVVSRIQLCNLVHHIADSFQNRAKQVGLELMVHLAPDLPLEVQGDVKWITQILNNLLGNAIKYTQQGHVRLQVYCGSPVHGNRNQHHITFEVEDTGRGIPQADQERILLPFEQTEEALNIEGTGLGLSIVSSLVEHLNGQLTIHSEMGKGSTFQVTIPMTLVGEDIGDPRAVDTPKGPRASSPPPSAPILLVDDNELNRFVASKLLSRWGYEVTEAVDGREAVAKWQDIGPCIILMDVQMPEMDGIEATQHIRRMELEQDRRRSPILALTADAEEETHKKVLAAGMDQRVVKPFDTAALQSILKRSHIGEPQG